MRGRLLPSGMLEGTHGIGIKTHATKIGDKSPWHKDCRWSKRRARRRHAGVVSAAWSPREEMRAHSDRIIASAVFALDEAVFGNADSELDPAWMT
jgi:hypothetical protein